MERPAGTFNETYEQDLAIVRTPMQWGLLIGFLILLFTMPLYASPYILGIFNVIGITVIAVLGLQILTGLGGQITLAQAALVGVGGYTSALLVTHAGFPWLVALPCAGLSAGIIGLIFGLPALRVKGFYLAFATLAAQFLLVWVFMHVKPDLLGGTDGIVVPPIKIGGAVLKSQQSVFPIIMGITVLMTLFAKNLMRTKTGRALIAIRDNDIAAEMMGIDLYRYKIIAFFICSFYAGIAGSLWAHYMRSLHPEVFTLMNSIWYLGMLIVGGMGSTVGAIFGVVFLRALNEGVVVLSPLIAGVFPALDLTIFPALTQALFGLIIVLFIILEPRGLAHWWETFKASYRLWPFTY